MFFCIRVKKLAMTESVVCVPVLGLITKLTQQDETNVTGITFEFCRDLHLALLYFGFLQKDLSKAR